MTETVDLQTEATEVPNPSGLCMCGCGGETRRSKSYERSGDFTYKPGQHKRFLPGHASQNRRDVASTRASADEREEGWERFIRSKSGQSPMHSEDVYVQKRRQRMAEEQEQIREEWAAYYQRLSITLRSQAERAEQQAQKLMGCLELEGASNGS